MSIHTKRDGSTVVKGKDGLISDNIPSPKKPDEISAEVSQHTSVLRQPATPPSDTRILENFERFSQLAAEESQLTHTAPAPAKNSGYGELAQHRINNSFPFPQANSLAKVAAALEAIDNGANTDDAVASAISVSDRQGAYYGTALGYLGLARDHGIPRQWELTPTGATFLESEPEQRAEILHHLVDQIPVGGYSEDGEINEVELADEVLSADSTLGQTTAARRAATIASWRNTLANPDVVNEMQLESDGVRDRIDTARLVAVSTRERSRRRATPVPAPVVCQECFQAKAANGSCGC